MAEDPRADTLSVGEIKSLGLLQATMEEKNLKVSKWIPHKKEG